MKCYNLKLEEQSLKYIKTKSDTMKEKKKQEYCFDVGNAYFSAGALKYLKNRTAI